MRRAISLLTATALLAAGCAPSPLPPRDPSAHLLLAEAALATSISAPTPTPTREERSSPSEPHDSGMPRAIGWFSIAIGAGAGLVAIGTSIMMLHQADLRSGDCNAAKVCSQSGLDANAELGGLASWNVGSYIVAAAGIGIGTILVLTNPKNERQTALGVSPNGSGAGLTLRSTF